MKERKNGSSVLEGWEVRFLQRRYFTRLLVVRLMLVLRYMSLQLWTAFCARAERGRQTAGLGLWILRRDAQFRRACQDSEFMYLSSRKELSVLREQSLVFVEDE
jgi:hypothetical protein